MPPRRPIDSPPRSGNPETVAPHTRDSPEWRDLDSQLGTEEGALERVIRIWRRRWWVILQAIAVVLVVVAGLTVATPTTYEAKATLELTEAQDLTGNTVFQAPDPQRRAASAERLLSLPVIAQDASKLLGGKVSADEIESAVDVQTSLDSDVFEIRATSQDATEAAEIANAYARAYVNFRRNGRQARIRKAIDDLRSRLASLPREQRARAQGRDVRNRIDALRVQSSLDDGGVQLVQPATRPTDPAGPSLLRNLALGLLLGAVLGVALAALMERLDTRVKKPEELERLDWVPVLARVPRLDGAGGRLARRARRDGRFDADEQQRLETLLTLRANVHSLLGKPAGAIVLTSPLPGDGKTTVAEQLARAMTLMDDRVVLVDADLHSPSPTTGGRSSPGLVSVLAGGSLDDALVFAPVEVDFGENRSLAVLPSGPRPPRPLRLLESAEMGRLIGTLEERFGTVIIDTPAISTLSDALSILPSAQGVLVVVGLGNTSRRALAETRDQLQIAGIVPLGLVLNFAPVEASAYRYYKR
jgi:capsular exopolysaccharide synthesis family protein